MAADDHVVLAMDDLLADGAISMCLSIADIHNTMGVEDCRPLGAGGHGVGDDSRETEYGQHESKTIHTSDAPSSFRNFSWGSTRPQLVGEAGVEVENT